MNIDKERYLKIKELLGQSLRKLSNEKNSESEQIIHQTRFDIKNKIYADQILKEVEARWKEDYYKLRIQWSLYIFSWLAWTILFQFFLAGFLIYWVSHNLFVFDKIHNLLFLMAWENFAQIIWLSYIIVRFLFSGKTNT